MVKKKKENPEKKIVAMIAKAANCNSARIIRNCDLKKVFGKKVG